jgi:hypothetical protein
VRVLPAVRDALDVSLEQVHAAHHVSKITEGPIDAVVEEQQRL